MPDRLESGLPDRQSPAGRAPGIKVATIDRLPRAHLAYGLSSFRGDCRGTVGRKVQRKNNQRCHAARTDEARARRDGTAREEPAMHSKPVLLLVTVLPACLSAANAQQPAAGTAPPVEVTAFRVPVLLTETPQGATVVGRREIE
jgi:hypothetical protein